MDKVRLEEKNGTYTVYVLRHDAEVPVFIIKDKKQAELMYKYINDSNDKICRYRERRRV